MFSPLSESTSGSSVDVLSSKACILSVDVGFRMSRASECVSARDCPPALTPNPTTDARRDAHAYESTACICLAAKVPHMDKKSNLIVKSEAHPTRLHCEQGGKRCDRHGHYGRPRCEEPASQRSRANGHVIVRLHDHLRPLHLQRAGRRAHARHRRCGADAAWHRQGASVSRYLWKSNCEQQDGAVHMYRWMCWVVGAHEQCAESRGLLLRGRAGWTYRGA